MQQVGEELQQVERKQVKPSNFKDDFTGWKNIEERDSIPSFVYVADDADAYIEFQQVPKGDKTITSDPIPETATEGFTFT